MYEKAVECNPSFDVALANLANAIKDMGHVQDSIGWYYKAVEINPHFPEAVCGLVNALGGVCDWRNRGSLGGDIGVGKDNRILDPNVPADVQEAYSGWMPRIAELVARQLAEGQAYGSGILRASMLPNEWLKFVAVSLAATPEVWASIGSIWTYRFNSLLTNTSNINEGGYVIRLVERLIRRTQRRWYIDSFGKTLQTPTSLKRPLPDQSAYQRYRRPPLPPSLPQPPVPTVLPFHTFTYPLTARQTRLISHRNALRISHSTLNQPWLLPTVYPPPSPPAPRLRIGYVSSDFNNHPLAHLMQSVFGMHDRTSFEVFCYATTASDQSDYRHKIEKEAEHFVDVSAWSVQDTVERIVADQIHILVNLCVTC